MDKTNIILPHTHDSNEEQVLKNMPELSTIQAVSNAMKQLGDPTRLQIFWLLCHCEECVVNIAAIVKMTSPAVSHHLRLLKDSGLINSRRDGKEVYYSASEDALAQSLHHTIEEIASITCPID
ncbi:MAG: ArsR/SmtB family transcription factor [Anaerovoracaceae bacterium]